MYKKCVLCARGCAADRTAGELGYCRMSDKIYISAASLHMWEEPPISGERGSGAVFFSGCSLGCVYCQNSEISRGIHGKEVTERELADIFLGLKSDGAHNINLVTPTHYAPSIRRALIDAKGRGLDIPIVYNTGSYDTVKTVELMSDVVDIWLPDLKYYRASTAGKYSFAKDLPEVSRAAIEKMHNYAPEPMFDEYGMIRSGVIVRLLLLPSHLAEAKLNLKYLYDKYRDSVYVSLMSQFTPRAGAEPPLNRRVTNSEYDELAYYAMKLGVKNAFIQERSSASDAYIPDFNRYKG